VGGRGVGTVGVTKRATYQDVLDAPEHKVAEILDGELVLSPMLASRVAVAHSRLQRIVGRAVDDARPGVDGWWIFSKPEVHLGEHVVVPDIGGWRRQDMPSFPDVDYFSTPPSWVCELLAPPTERFDRSRKLRIYAEAGVGHAWLVKPGDRTLEVLRLRDGLWTIVGVWADAAVVRAEPFEATELELARLWPDEATAAPPAR
jgi:Uma2 family endonuclease